MPRNPNQREEEETDLDRTRSGDWRDERYDEHRFSQDEDDKAGRSWHVVEGDLEIEDPNCKERDRSRSRR